MIRANGKLLLTGEYLVLDGALSLAFPTRKGQTLLAKKSEKKGFFWKSINNDGSVWFEDELFVQSENSITQNLEKIILSAYSQISYFEELTKNISVETYLEFPRDWGLGSSSTLISLVAQWAGVNPYQLLTDSFGGSGYDVACAMANSPILYQLVGEERKVYPVDFQIDFKDKLFFIYLNQKQNSREGIAQYRKNKKNKSKAIEQITEITENMLRFPSYSAFCEMIDKHEEIVSSLLNMNCVKSLYFNDFQGSIKSLGAWGGDFILATGEEMYVKDYFSSKGYLTIIPYREMIL